MKTNEVRRLHRTDVHPQYPNRILQIGEGNFLRCFIDWQVDILNEKNGLDAGIIIARPIDSTFPPSLNTQDGLYTTILRGYDDAGALRDEKRLITSTNGEISIYGQFNQFLALAKDPDLRFIISNTTEAGIAFDDTDQYNDQPPAQYPAKLTRFLHERFLSFNGDKKAGLILLPCELIDDNGEELKRIVLQYIGLWELEDTFREWVEIANTFCSTLVDRIVTGYPKQEAEKLEQELGYKDQFLVVGEFFHLLVIQAPEYVADELKLAGSGLNIKVVKDLKPYKKRKVGILNGSHTALVPVAYLSGLDLVKEAVSDPAMANFLEQLLEQEIIPGLGMDERYLKEYAATVIGRFKNPFIEHRLLDISLNSMSKFKTRLLPQFVEFYKQRSTVPPLMSLSLAALICFYRGVRGDEKYPVNDDTRFIKLYQQLWNDAGSVDQVEAIQIATAILELDDHWGLSLAEFDGLAEKVGKDIFSIQSRGMRETLAGYLS